MPTIPAPEPFIARPEAPLDTRVVQRHLVSEALQNCRFVIHPTKVPEVQDGQGCGLDLQCPEIVQLAKETEPAVQRTVNGISTDLEALKSWADLGEVSENDPRGLGEVASCIVLGAEGDVERDEVTAGPNLVGGDKRCRRKWGIDGCEGSDGCWRNGDFEVQEPIVQVDIGCVQLLQIPCCCTAEIPMETLGKLRVIIGNSLDCQRCQHTGVAVDNGDELGTDGLCWEA